MALQFCVVCGRGSTRSLWNYSMTVGPTTYVGCDFHSFAEFQASIQNVINPPGPGESNQDPAVDESQGA